MKCRDFERLLCDYLDDALDLDERRRMEEHSLSCAGCSEALAESGFSLGLLRDAPAVAPPAELIADIIHDTVGVGSGRLLPAGADAGGGLSGWLRPLFGPILQPRFVMSMAMTVLSFSMLTFYGQRAVQQYQANGDSPRAALTALSRPVTDLWSRAETAVDAAAAFYELQTGPFHSDRKAEPSGDPQPAGEAR